MPKKFLTTAYSGAPLKLSQCRMTLRSVMMTFSRPRTTEASTATVPNGIEVHKDDIQQHTVEASTGTVPRGTDVPTEDFLGYITVTVPGGIEDHNADIQQDPGEASSVVVSPVIDLTGVIIASCSNSIVLKLPRLHILVL